MKYVLIRSDSWNAKHYHIVVNHSLLVIDAALISNESIRREEVNYFSWAVILLSLFWLASCLHPSDIDVILKEKKNSQ